ncbi:hypothetical protein ILUMI_05886 [Ignelater luminosus]|uniref:PiggyBac transposable element-derived protein domain-containing protein n=1 Tax=Ignelater luminosus TaxID=2038154 RepID=A0A8K0GD52_IGNLU|nr:hypothetical protein ILUMI_05886 [Ignelater luminosus]
MQSHTSEEDIFDSDDSIADPNYESEDDTSDENFLEAIQSKKPIKRDYKLWCIGSQHGYILQFNLYQGKNEALETKFEHFGLGERVVLLLSKHFWNEGRTLYFDHYFTCIKLLERLKLEKTLACGTIRKNRKDLPKNMTDEKKLKREEFDCRYCNSQIGYFVRMDNTAVHFAINFHGTEITNVRQKQRDESMVNVQCPSVVEDYKRNMGGIDFADQFRSAYSIDTKSRKWWHRLFRGMMDISLVNASVAMGLFAYSTYDLSNKRRSQESLPGPSHKRRKYNYSVLDDVSVAQVPQNQGHSPNVPFVYVIKSLENVFGRKDALSKLFIMKKLLKLKCTPEDHFVQIESLLRELGEVRTKLDESDKACYLLLTMQEKSAMTGRYKRWNEADMKEAIAAVNAKKMGWLKAANTYRVPQATLRRRARSKTKDPMDPKKF